MQCISSCIGRIFVGLGALWLSSASALPFALYLIITYWQSNWNGFCFNLYLVVGWLGEWDQM